MLIKLSFLAKIYYNTFRRRRFITSADMLRRAPSPENGFSRFSFKIPRMSAPVINLKELKEKLRWLYLRMILRFLR